MSRKVVMALVAAAAAGAIVVWALPPKGVRLAAPGGWEDLASRTIAGAYHVHSKRSDGSGDKAAIASAAARAGLKFVVITDHGDATRAPDPPEYVNGVLCLDAVEISTSDGHYVALDMTPAPYPLGGAAEAVVEDVQRLGGFGIAAHPDSPKPALRWTVDDLPLDGVEWLNADSEWRDESRLALTRAALGYLMRPPEALARLLDRPVTLARWDRWSESRPIVGLAAADAHGGLGGRPEDPRGGAYTRLGIPSYEASFRTFSNRVVLDRPLTGNASTDARSVFDAIRSGHVFSAIDALASPALLDFHRDRTALVARALTPPGSQLVMFHRGSEVARTAGSELRWESGGDRGPYRVEVLVPGAPGEPPVPWLVSNELFTTVSEPKPTVTFEVPWTGAVFPPAAWHVEKESASSETLSSGPSDVRVLYSLSSSFFTHSASPTAGEGSPFVAVATDLHDRSFTSVEVGLTGEHPMRISVQVRTADGRRWGSSVYVDQTNRLFSVPLASMRSFDDGAAAPASSSITSVLLVVDLTNSRPGSSGSFEIRSFRLIS